MSKRREIAAIERLVTDTLHTGQSGERGHQINRAADLRDGVPGGQFRGPADVAHGAHAALVGGAFFALHAAGPAHGVGAVVGEIDDDGVVLDAVLLQPRKHAAHVHVLVLDHRQSAAGFIGDFLCCLRGGLRDGLVLEALPIRLWSGPGRVRRGEGDVADEGLVFVLVDEAEGAIRADIDDVALRADHRPFSSSGASKYSPQCPEVWPKYSSNPRAIG
jgi:hypothetical protein